MILDAPSGRLQKHRRHCLMLGSPLVMVVFRALEYRYFNLVHVHPGLQARHFYAEVAMSGWRGAYWPFFDVSRSGL